MQNNKSEEKRKFPRVNAKFPIRYQIKRGGFIVSAMTDDLSLSGIRLSGDRFFPQGLNLNLELNILSRVINPIGRVIWSQPLPSPNQYQMGIEFIDINSEDVNHLSDYINSHTPELSDLEK